MDVEIYVKVKKASGASGVKSTTTILWINKDISANKSRPEVSKFLANKDLVQLSRQF